MMVRAIGCLAVSGVTFVAAVLGGCSGAPTAASAQSAPPISAPAAEPLASRPPEPVPAPIAKPPAGATPATVAESIPLADALVAELGTPVAIVPAPEGIVAVSADGTQSRVLVVAEVWWLLVDNRARVVWFRVADTLRVLDLLAPDPAPQVVASGVPFAVSPEGTAGFLVDYGRGEVLRIGHPAYHTIILDLEPEEPALLGDGGVWQGDPEFDGPMAAVVLTEEMRAYLRELVLRGAGRALVLPDPPPIETRLDVDPSACEEQELCGKVEAIPGIGLWQVILGHSCGDGCYLDLGVYDPATEEYLDVSWAPLLHSLWISGDGKAAIYGGTILSLPDGRVLFGEMPQLTHRGGGGGWLGEEWYLGW